MGSAQTKDNIITQQTTPVRIQKQRTESSLISPLQKTMSASKGDPRSPGGRRTPVLSAHSTPNLSKNTRERMMMRMHEGNKSKSQDPRSPSMLCRTPLHLSAVEGVPRTPPPFRSADPRSPATMRTPLTLSTQDAVVVPDDLVIVGEEIAGELVVFAEEIVMGEKQEIANGASVEIIASDSSVDEDAKVVSQLASSAGVSDGIMALVMSPLDSPSVGRKRKDITRTQGLSPLKKSYSAPLDENTPPSPVNKPLAATARARTPLSPLSRSTRRQHCVAVPPIKFRMDPGILG